MGASGQEMRVFALLPESVRNIGLEYPVFSPIVQAAQGQFALCLCPQPCTFALYCGWVVSLFSGIFSIQHWHTRVKYWAALSAFL
jgi:hypothetical protein